MLGIDENAEYAIWISYAEVYNEHCYDLLQEPPVDIQDKKGVRRKALKLMVILLLLFFFFTLFSFFTSINFFFLKKTKRHQEQIVLLVD